MPGEIQQVVEGTSPTQTRPEVLSADALKPSSLSIAEQIARNRTANPTQPRRPGRPPGSKNRTTIPSTPEEGDASKAEAEARRLRALNSQSDSKKKKVEDYTNKIVDDLNGQIMGGLISMGIPSTILYKNGQPPIKVVDTNYTPIANQLAIQPMQARAVASFLVELEFAEQGSIIGRAATTLNSGTGALVLKGLFAGAMTFMYIKGAVDTMSKLGPILQQYQAAMEAQARQNQQAHTMAHGQG